MKKYLFLPALLLMSYYTYCQAKVEVGLKGGLNLSSLNIDEPEANYKSATGYHFGAYGQVKIANLGIQPEILYSVRGTEVNYDNVKTDFQQDFVYMDIPVMLKLYLMAGVNLQVGPQFGVLISADGEVYDPETNTVSSIDEDSYKAADISAALGAGWDAPFGLNFTARYILGMTDLTSASTDAKNRTFQLSVGFKLFKIGR